MPAPGVFVGVDIAKGKHYACAVSASGEALFARAVPNDQGAIRRMISDAAEPRTLLPVGIIFAYLTLVGVVVPVIGLLWRPGWSDLLIRIVLVSLFVAGLFVLGWYLIRAILRLSKSSVPQDHDEHTQAENGEPPEV